MRILLIQPGFFEIYGNFRHLYKKGFKNAPLSLCYLASALQNAGHEVIIIDAEAEMLSHQEIIIKTREFAPNLIGYTATSVDFIQCLKTATSLKQAFPNIPTLLGGTHINIFKEEILKANPCFDFGCLGDGEKLIVELAEALENRDPSQLSNIQGLYFRDGDQVVVNQERPVNYNIDEYAFPNRTLINNDFYQRSVPFRGKMNAAAFIGARGCPFSCVYCAIDNIPDAKKVRFRSVDNIMDELEYIIHELGIDHITFNDDVLTLKKKHVYELCEGIHKRGLKFTWEGLSRADIIDRDMLRTMKAAGLIRFCIGIESANQEVLDVMRKDETIEEIENAIRMAKEEGIVTRGSVIIGSPYENQERVQQTFDFINKKLKSLDQVCINIMQPYPGTKVREMFLNNEGGSKFLGDINSSEDLQRFGNAAIQVNDLTPEKLVFLQRYGFFQFYSRPSIIWRNLKISGWSAFFLDGWGMFRSIVGSRT